MVLIDTFWRRKSIPRHHRPIGQATLEERTDRQTYHHTVKQVLHEVKKNSPVLSRMTVLEINLLLKVSDRHWLTVGWQVCAKPLTQCTLIDGLEVTMVISYIVAFGWLYAIQPLVDDLQSTRADNWNVDSLYNVHPAPLPRRPRPLSVSRRRRSRSRSRSPSRGRRRWRRSKSSTLSDRLFVVRQFYLRVICVVRWTVIQGKTYEIKLVIFKICVTLLQIGHAFVVNQITVTRM